MSRKDHGNLYKAPIMGEKGKGLKGEGDQIKFIDLRLERWHIVGQRKQGGKIFHKLHVLGMNDDLWDKVCGLCSETWKGGE